MNYIFIILAFVISVFIARLIIPRILMISLRKKLFDIPDERKIHKRAIPHTNSKYSGSTYIVCVYSSDLYRYLDPIW